MKPRYLITICLLSLCLAAAQVHAEWALDASQSSINFLSVKNNSVAEIHSFDSIEGRLTGTGDARLSIDLASVNTRIGIRDERMREFLFEIGRFPSATISAVVENAALVEPGASQVITLPLNLSLHGYQGTASAVLDVIRLDEDTLRVATRTPVIVQATDFALLQGLAKLQELAGLQSISPAVPVTASLVFRRVAQRDAS